MKLAGRGPVDLKDRVLGPVVAEIVRSVLEPSVEDRFMAIVIVTAAEHHLLLDPYQVMLESESSAFESLDESAQQRSGCDGCVTCGALLRVFHRERERACIV